uniref:Conopeptide n=1 Tax=Conus lenavati TaxID=1519839 RepID=A0A0K8TTR8_CONLV
MMMMMMAMPVKADQCDNHPTVNGCSVPDFLRVQHLKTLTPACNRHDVCYGCGAKYGVTKTQCDDAFLRDMKEACRQAGRRRALTVSMDCPDMANAFHTAVWAFGHSHYVDAGTPNSDCREDLDKPCLP